MSPELLKFHNLTQHLHFQPILIYRDFIAFD
jgi:hypothetical protein